jgi:hypothetical protein
MYDIGLPSGRTLFHLHCERVQRARVLAAQAAGVDVSAVEIINQQQSTHTILIFSSRSCFILKHRTVGT